MVVAAPKVVVVEVVAMGVEVAVVAAVVEELLPSLFLLALTLPNVRLSYAKYALLTYAQRSKHYEQKMAA